MNSKLPRIGETFEPVNTLGSLEPCSHVRNLHESGVPRLFSYIQRGVVDEVRVLAVLAGLLGSGVPGFAALYAEVSVGYVLRRYRLLLPLDCLPLLLHLEVAQDGHQQEEDDEAHAAADYQAQPPRKEAADTANIAHGRAIATDYRVRRVQRLHLGATAGRGVRHLRARCGREYLDLREIELFHRPILYPRRHPVTETEYTDQVAGVRRQFRQFHRARVRLEYFGTYLEFRAIKVMSHLRELEINLEKDDILKYFYKKIQFL